MSKACLGNFNILAEEEQNLEGRVAAHKSCSSDCCDLHIHTVASDGQLTPLEVLSVALEANLKAISICDHDTIAGFSELSRLYPSLADGTLLASGIEVIPGIEINSEWETREIHLIGYFCETKSQEFASLLASLRETRLQRVKLILDKLRDQEIIVDISQVLDRAKGESVGRPHIAEVMVEEGYVGSIGEAFNTYIGLGKPAYVGRFRLTPAECVKAIRRANGVAVWAHPGMANADHLLKELIESGLQGLEVYHPEHDRNAMIKYTSLALEHGLAITGGSDFHSYNRPYGALIGSYGVTYESVQRIRDLAQENRK
ncbi:MAG: PHP domain-containing protein [Firmicutes bacterium]|nr:PHP domain-containing protein [Candidatus Fermentithermobacillaceae bacterium]